MLVPYPYRGLRQREQMLVGLREQTCSKSCSELEY